jgi:hypothetical protein
MINIEEYEFINGRRIKKLKPGLYAKLPIPAYRYLGSTGEHFAKDVLICLVSFVGLQKETNVVNPSIEMIMSLTKRSERSVRQGLNVLVSKGYITKKTVRKGRFQHNEYMIQETCYTFTDEMRDAIAIANREVRRINRMKKQKSLLRTNNQITPL